MKGNNVEKTTNATAYRQADLQIPTTVYSVDEVREKKGRSPCKHDAASALLFSPFP